MWVSPIGESGLWWGGGESNAHLKVGSVLYGLIQILLNKVCAIEPYLHSYI